MGIREREKETRLVMLTRNKVRRKKQNGDRREGKETR